jgi:hypothetical protein
VYDAAGKFLPTCQSASHAELHWNADYAMPTYVSNYLFVCLFFFVCSTAFAHF